MRTYWSGGVLLLILSHGMSAAQTTIPDLPKSFRFCVATAAHQIEGHQNETNYNSDWWKWEQTGHTKNGDTSEIATDSWNHVDEDIRNMVALGVDTYRFSVEWAKIEPSPHVFDEAMLDRYVSLIDRLKQNNIESMVTLYHFTLPVWVSDQGGWEWDGIADAFDEFTRKVATRIGPKVTLWITLNEPITIISAGYISNIFPPAKNNIKEIGLPMANMVRAHACAYHTLHEVLDSNVFKPKVGIAHHLRVFNPLRRLNPFDHYLSRKFDEVSNWAIPDALITGVLKFSVPALTKANYFIPEAIGTQDFFGLNYYSRDLISLSFRHNPPIVRSVPTEAAVSDLNWEIYPQGMGELLERIHDYYPDLPIWITENGLADQTDEKRMPFIEAHLNEIADQIKVGVPVEGYCHWTLNDNFEWAEGYTAHFGFYRLEPSTLKRIARPSVEAFSKLVNAVKQKK